MGLHCALVARDGVLVAVQVGQFQNALSPCPINALRAQINKHLHIHVDISAKKTQATLLSDGEFVTVSHAQTFVKS